MPKTKYVWAIGDGLIIDSDKIQKILNYLEKNYDFIVFDFMDRLKNETIKEEYSNEIEFFRDLTWHVTLLGSTILKKSLIEKTLKYNSKKYVGGYFIHLGILLEAISREKFQGIVKVYKKNILKKKSGWSDLVFTTFCDSWINFINLLPEIYNSQKENVIKSHGVKSKLFSIKSFVSIRINCEEYSLKDIYKNRKNIKRITSVPNLIIYLIWLFPKPVLIEIKKILKKGIFNE